MNLSVHSAKVEGQIRLEMFLGSPNDFRRACRSGEWCSTTSGLFAGFLQCNVVIIPSAFGSEFTEFCAANAESCPLVDILEPGSPVPSDRVVSRTTGSADIRTDCPAYNVFRSGSMLKTVKDVQSFFFEDSQAFLLGCSFSFESSLQKHGISVRNVQQGRNVSMFRTNILCHRRGIFGGNMVVTMRPIPSHRVADVVEITRSMTSAHGGPIHVGDPAKIGIRSLEEPDFGDRSDFLSGEVPVFWPCGVTASETAVAACPGIVVTHSPGCMFVTDVRVGEL